MVRTAVLATAQRRVCSEEQRRLQKRGSFLQRDSEDGKVSWGSEEDGSSMNECTGEHCQRGGLGTNSVRSEDAGGRKGGN